MSLQRFDELDPQWRSELKRRELKQTFNQPLGSFV
jgi:hypothetical protein